MQEKYYIGADLGTSALKLLLVGEDKNILKCVKREYEVFYPQSGWSEQNPDDWWDAFLSGVKELVCGIDPKNVDGIAVAGQMHGLVILDKDDRVIRPAILWNDGRCDKETEYLNCTIGKSKLSELTGNIAFAGFTAPKILWLKNNEPQNFNSVKKLMLPKDYINYRLTGVHSTDFSDASGMLLLDVKNRCWSDKMLEISDVPTKDGFEFDKWLGEDGNGFDMKAPINASITLLASFKKSDVKDITVSKDTDSTQGKKTNSSDLMYLLFSIIGLAVIGTEAGIIIYKKRSKR